MNRYGFVHMAREEDAATAIKSLHNSNFKGATINVEQSTGKSRGGGGGGGGGGRRDGDRRGGPMRGGRGGRDGGRDGRPGPYNDRRGENFAVLESEKHFKASEFGQGVSAFQNASNLLGQNQSILV